MIKQQISLKYSCLVCEQSSLAMIQGFAELPRITSDCRSFPPGGELFVCEACGAVQKKTSTRWLNEIEEIYRDYSAYSLAGGEEQLVLDPETAKPAKRSDVLVQSLTGNFNFHSNGRALDVGCGHGVTLSALSVKLPKWRLCGYELDEGNLAELKKIVNFEHLYVGELAAIDDMFDLVSMIHSLEHFVDPIPTLSRLRQLMGPEGRLFVEVCNVEENPFDLVVADHLMHFSPNSLRVALERSGFHVECIETTWVKKELSVVASPGQVDSSVNKSEKLMPETKRITNTVRWLANLVESARASARQNRRFGIFGTSIAASWLASSLIDEVEFFVDEDPHRIGREYFGKPVIGPNQVPYGAAVFLALAPTLADSISRRLSGLPIVLIAPPSLPCAKC